MTTRELNLKLNLTPNTKEVRGELNRVVEQIGSIRHQAIKLKVLNESPQTLTTLLKYQKAAADQQRRYESHPLVQSAKRQEDMASAMHQAGLKLNTLNIKAKIDVDALTKDTQRKLESHPLNIKAKVQEENLAAAHAKAMEKALGKEQRAQWQPKTIFGHIAKALGGKAPSAEAQAAGGLKGAGAEAGALATIPGVGAAIGAVGAVGGAIGMLGDVAMSTVGKLSPGAMQRFNYALDDVQAVIGKALLPVINLMTDGLRLVGDVLNSILPSTDDMTAALSPIEEIFDTLRETFTEMAPVLKEVGHLLLEGLVVSLKLVADGIKIVASFIEGFFKGLGEGAGLDEVSDDAQKKINDVFRKAFEPILEGDKIKPNVTAKEWADVMKKMTPEMFAEAEKIKKEDKKLKSSVGTAARSVTFESQESAAKKVYQAAQMGGVSRKRSIEDLLGEGSPMMQVLNSIDKWVTWIADKMGAAGQAAGQAAGAAGDWGSYLWNSATHWPWDMSWDKKNFKQGG